MPSTPSPPGPSGRVKLNVPLYLSRLEEPVDDDVTVDELAVTDAVLVSGPEDELAAVFDVELAPPLADDNAKYAPIEATATITMIKMMMEIVATPSRWPLAP